LIRRAYDISEFEKEVSFDRLFPNQDSISKGGYGNLIALPFQGKSVLQGNTVFIDLGTDCPFPDQWIFLREVRRYSRKEIDEVHQKIFEEKVNLSIPVETAKQFLIISVSNKVVLSYSQLSPLLRDFLKE
jgi:hypothetical protein